MLPQQVHSCDYLSVQAAASTPEGGVDTAALQQVLESLCIRAYKGMTLRPTEILSVSYGTFEYIFDDLHSLEAHGFAANDPLSESRLVLAIGRSSPQGKKRDDYRLKGWIGQTGKVFGSTWDKGHYIGNALGGAVDRLELNVFVQRRDLNRGWSQAGKRYREMEVFCARNSGTLCFSRPIYLDGTARPAYLEFGLLRPDGTLWVERFDNREHTSALMG